MKTDSLMASTKHDEIRRLVDFIEGMLNGRKATYLSCPITSGRLRLQFLRNHSGKDLESESLQWEKVIEPNIELADLRGREIARQRKTPMICPALLPQVVGWEQPDYNAMWGKVVQDHAIEVIFLRDWQYSTGCTYEYLKAHGQGIRCYTEEGDLIDSQMAVGLLNEAISDWAQSHTVPPLLLQAMRILQEDQGN